MHRVVGVRVGVGVVIVLVRFERGSSMSPVIERRDLSGERRVVGAG